MQRIAMHRTRLRWFTLCIILFLVVHVAGEDVKSVCSTVVQCRRKNVGTVCDRNVEECPPCVNLLDDTITCWEKDPATKLCQFAGEKYDCTDVWHSEGILTYPPSVLANNTETPYVKTKSTATTATSSNSKYILYGAIGGGVLFILVLAVFFIRRRRQQNMQTQKFSAHDTPTFIMEKNEYDLSQHEEVSVLGDPLPSQRSRGGGGEKKKTRFDMVDRYTTEKIVSDVAARVTQAHTNVFDEYLRMKKEMKFDEQSERGTQVSSVSMMESELGSVAGHNTRSDSECFSEMTYNDEKYSFSEDVVIARDREIEI